MKPNSTGVESFDGLAAQRGRRSALRSTGDMGAQLFALGIIVGLAVAFVAALALRAAANGGAAW